MSDVSATMLRSGSRSPRLELLDAAGGSKNLSDFWGQGSALLLFIRSTA